MRVISNRRGFALLAILWVLIGLGVLSVAASLAAREAVATARNRVMLTRASWRAEGCMAQLRSALADAMERDSAPGGVKATWANLSTIVRETPQLLDIPCEVTWRAAGSVVDVNLADRDQLVALFVADDVPGLTADSLADAILDWRDPDDVARPLGAERAWYDSAHRDAPRNGSFADSRELSRVRGFDRFPRLAELLGVEVGRVSLACAPAPVLASLPGFTDEAVQRVLELRASREQIPELLVLAGLLSRPAHDSLTARYSDLLRVAVVEPDAWNATIAASEGSTPSVTATIDVRFVRAGARVAIVRRRGWP